MWHKLIHVEWSNDSQHTRQCIVSILHACAVMHTKYIGLLSSNEGPSLSTTSCMNTFSTSTLRNSTRKFHDPGTDCV